MPETLVRIAVYKDRVLWMQLCHILHKLLIKRIYILIIRIWIP